MSEQSDTTETSVIADPRNEQVTDRAGDVDAASASVPGPPPVGRLISEVVKAFGGEQRKRRESTPTPSLAAGEPSLASVALEAVRKLGEIIDVTLAENRRLLAERDELAHGLSAITGRLGVADAYPVK